MLKGWPWVRVAILEVISDTLSHPDSDKAETMDLRQNVIESIRTLAKRNGVCKVILFGSRARGDNSARSDIDLAASGGNVAKFALDVDEETPTLLSYDVVDLDRPVRQVLIQDIRRDGVVLFEQQKA